MSRVLPDSLQSAREALAVGNLSWARRLITQATSENPRYAEPWHLLGLTLLEEGKVCEAINCLEQSSRLDPANADYTFALADAYCQAGAFPYASPLFQRYLRLRPADGLAWAKLAESYVRSDRLSGGQKKELATPLLQRAIELSPGNASIALLAADLLEQMGDVRCAAECLRMAMAMAPDEILPPYSLASLLHRNGETEAAANMYRALLQAVWDVPEAHFGLGNILAELGQFQDARVHYCEAMKGHPSIAKVVYNYCSITPIDVASFPQVVDWLSSVDGNATSERDVALAHFALGKSLSDLKRHDDAFEHYQQGNELLGSQYDAQGHAQLVDATIAACRRRPPSSLLQGPNGQLKQSVRKTNAVFIVGMPRSGTTMVEQAIARSHDVELLGERSDFPQGLLRLEQDRGWPLNDPANWLLAEPSDLENLGKGYLESVAADTDKAWVVDKLPGNFHYLHWIVASLPGAKVIHCRRDARDVCLSCYFQPFSSNFDFTNDLSHLAMFHNDYTRLMQAWRELIKERMLEVDYETFVASPERETSRLLEFLGIAAESLPLQRSTESLPLEKSTPKAAIRTASVWQARQKVHRQSVGKWRDYEKHLAPLIAVLDTRELRFDHAPSASVPHLFSSAASTLDRSTWEVHPGLPRS